MRSFFGRVCFSPGLAAVMVVVCVSHIIVIIITAAANAVVVVVVVVVVVTNTTISLWVASWSSSVLAKGCFCSPGRMVLLRPHSSARG